MTVLPVTAPLAATAPAPHPRGLVGMERAARPGEGMEFAKVRPFGPGDRLRRIHWPVSARTGRLHVTATYADEDAHVAVLIDAVNDVGESTGIDGEKSSMDLAVRAAAVLAEHFLRRGDRVGVRVFGDWGVSMIPASTGQFQLRRILDTLCLIEPGTARGEDALAARQGLGAGTLALMLSPLIDRAATQQVAILNRAGIEVVVIDTLPPGTGGGDRYDGRGPRLADPDAAAPGRDDPARLARDPRHPVGRRAQPRPGAARPRAPASRRRGWPSDEHRVRLHRLRAGGPRRHPAADHHHPRHRRSAS